MSTETPELRSFNDVRVALNDVYDTVRGFIGQVDAIQRDRSRLDSSLREVDGKMSDTRQLLADALSKRTSLEEGLAKLASVEKTTKRMRKRVDVAHDRMEQIPDMLHDTDRLNGEMKDAYTRLDSLGDEAEKGFKTANKKLKREIARVEQEQQEAEDRCNEKIEQMREEMARMSKTMASMQKQITQNREVIDENTRVSDEIQGRANEQSEKTDGLEGKLNSTKSKLGKLHDAFVAEVEQNADNTNSLTEAVQKLRKVTKGHEAEINALKDHCTELTNANEVLDGKVDDVASSIGEELQRVTNELKASIEDTDERLTKVVSRTKGSLQNAGENIEIVRVAGEEVRADFEELKAELRQRSDKLSLDVVKCVEQNATVGERLSRGLNEFQQVKSSLVNRVDKIDATTSSVIHDMQKDLTDSSESTDKNIRSVDTKLKRIISEKLDIVEKRIEKESGVRQEAVSTIEHWFEKFCSDPKGEWRLLIGRVDNVDERCTEVMNAMEDIEAGMKAGLGKSLKSLRTKIDSANEGIERLSVHSEEIEQGISERLDQLKAMFDKSAEMQRERTAAFQGDINGRMSKVQDGVDNAITRMTADIDGALKEAVALRSSCTGLESSLGELAHKYNKSTTALVSSGKELRIDLDLLRGKSGVTVDALVDRLKRLKDDIDGGFAHEAEKLEASIETVNGRFESIRRQGDERDADYRSSMAEIQANLKEASGQSRAYTDSVVVRLTETEREIYTRISTVTGGSGTSIVDVIGRIENVEDGIRVRSHKVDAGFATVRDFISETERRNVESHEGLKRSAEQKYAEIATVHKQIRVTISETAANAVSLVEKANELTKSVEQRLDSRMDDLTASTGERSAAIEKMVEEAREIIAQVETAAAEKLDSTQALIRSDFERSADELRSHIGMLNGHVAGIRGEGEMNLPFIIRKLDNHEKATKAQFAVVSEQVYDTARDLAERLKTAERQMGLTENDLRGQISEVNEREKKSKQELEQSHAQVTADITEMVRIMKNEFGETIEAVRGGSEGTILAVENSVRDLVESTTVFSTKTKDDLARLRTAMDELGDDIRVQLKGEITATVTEARHDKTEVMNRLDEIGKRQKECATCDYVKEVDGKLVRLIGDSTVSIPYIVGVIDELRAETVSKMGKSNKSATEILDIHRAELDKLSHDIRELNNGSGMSIQRAFEGLRDLNVAVVECKDSIGRTDRKMDTEVTDLRARNENVDKKYAMAFAEFEQRFEAEVARTETTIAEMVGNEQKQWRALSDANQILVKSVDDRFLKERNKVHSNIMALNTGLSQEVVRLSTELNDLSVKHNDLRAREDRYDEETTVAVNRLQSQMERDTYSGNEKLERAKDALQAEIQSLLATARQGLTDQFSQVSGTLRTDLATMKTSFMHFVGDAKETLPDLLYHNARVLAAVTEIRSDMESGQKTMRGEFMDRVGEVDNRSKARRQKARDALSAERDRQDAGRSTLDEQIRNLETAMTGKVDDLEARSTQALNDRLRTHSTEVESRFDKIVSSQTSFATMLKSAENDMLQARKGVDEAQKRQKDDFDAFIGSAGDMVRQKLADHEQRLAHIRDEMHHQAETAVTKCDRITEVLTNNLEEVRKVAVSGPVEATKIAREMIGKQSLTIGVLKSDTENYRLRMDKTVVELKQSFDKLRDEDRTFRTEQSGEVESLQSGFNAFGKDIEERMMRNSQAVDEQITSGRKALEEIQEMNRRAMDSMNEMATLTLQEKKDELQRLLEGAQKSLTASMETLRSSQTSKNEEFDTRISNLKTMQGTHRQKVKDHIENFMNLRRDYDELTLSHQKLAVETGHAIERASRVNQFMEEADRRISSFSDKVTGSFQELVEKVNTIVRQSEQDMSSIQTEMEMTRDDIMSLKRIRFLNAQYEQFEQRFDEMLVYFQQVQRSIWRFATPCEQLWQQANDRSKAEEDRMSSVSRMKLAKLDAKDFFVVDMSHANEADLGKTIIAAFRSHKCVSVTIPERTTVTWNKSVELLPDQILVLNGGRHSAITMEGSTCVGELRDPSRLVLDGFCQVRVNGVKVHTRCVLNRTQMTLDLKAIIVVRSWDTSGISAVDINNCEFDTDVPVVNIGANAVANVVMTETRIANQSPGSEVVHPVTVESGGYGQGRGSVTTRRTRIVAPRVQWLDSDYLVRSEERRD